jgi:hypothetical protein
MAHGSIMGDDDDNDEWYTLENHFNFLEHRS